MERTVTSHLDLGLSAPAKLVFAIAVAQGAPFSRESLSITVDGQAQQPAELVDVTGNRLHVLETSGSQLTLDYEAVVGGQFAPPPVDEFDLITFLRPSRYCESDTLGPTAASQFSGLEDQELLAAVTDWVAGQLTYVPGSSLPTDGAVRTLLGRQGVCRDFAHLCIALLRALNVPARLAAVFAPGLSPMEYHAVCEAYLTAERRLVHRRRHPSGSAAEPAPGGHRTRRRRHRIPDQFRRHGHPERPPSDRGGRRFRYRRRLAAHPTSLIGP